MIEREHGSAQPSVTDYSIFNFLSSYFSIQFCHISDTAVGEMVEGWSWQGSATPRSSVVCLKRRHNGLIFSHFYTHTSYCEREIAYNWRGNVKRRSRNLTRHTKWYNGPIFPVNWTNTGGRSKYGGSRREASGKYGFRAALTRMPPLYRSCKNCLFSVLWQIRQRQIQMYGKYGMPPPLYRRL